VSAAPGRPQPARHAAEGEAAPASLAAPLLAERARLARAAARDVPSPCVSICRMSAASGLCEGCWRSLAEISAWSRMADPAKREVWALIEQRAGWGVAMP